VHEEPVIDLGEQMDGVDVVDQTDRGLRLTDRDDVLGFQAAEDRARVVTDRLTGLGEDVVRVVVTRVRQVGVADRVSPGRVGPTAGRYSVSH
jgi:hypothetical protein